MRKIILLGLCLLCVSHSLNSAISQTCVVQSYLSQVGVRELTGKNDGRQVEAYLKTCGLGKGYAWCSAFVKWNFTQCGLPTPSMNAWAATAQNTSYIIYRARSFTEPPQSADVFTIWDASKKRVSHTGFFHKRINEIFYQTVEGNTNEGGSANGDGVYMRKRSFNATHTISRWLYN